MRSIQAHESPVPRTHHHTTQGVQRSHNRSDPGPSCPPRHVEVLTDEDALVLQEHAHKTQLAALDVCQRNVPYGRGKFLKNVPNPGPHEDSQSSTAWPEVHVLSMPYAIPPTLQFFPLLLRFLNLLTTVSEPSLAKFSRATRHVFIAVSSSASAPTQTWLQVVAAVPCCSSKPPKPCQGGSWISPRHLGHER